MHATVEQLLSLRDNKLVDAAVSQHTAACPVCSKALESYRQIKASLNELPQLEPPSADFAKVLERASVSPASGGYEWLKMGVAALVVAVGSVVLMQYIHTKDPTQPVAGNPDTTVAPAPNGALGQLMAESEQLEEALRRVSYGGRDVMDVRTADAIVALEDRLARVDYTLSHAHLTHRQAQALWQERVRLMNSLVGVRYAQFRNTSY